MTLSARLSTASLIINSTPVAPEKSAEVGEMLFRAGAALYSVSRSLTDIATRLSLSHTADVSEVFSDLEDCQKLLLEGEDAEVLGMAIISGDLDVDSLPAVLARNNEPALPFAAGIYASQGDLANHAATTLDKVSNLIARVVDLPQNSPDFASTLLFDASEICLAAPAELEVAGRSAA